MADRFDPGGDPLDRLADLGDRDLAELVDRLLAAHPEVVPGPVTAEDDEGGRVVIGPVDDYRSRLDLDDDVDGGHDDGGYGDEDGVGRPGVVIGVPIADQALAPIDPLTATDQVERVTGPGPSTNPGGPDRDRGDGAGWFNWRSGAVLGAAAAMILAVLLVLSDREQNQPEITVEAELAATPTREVDAADPPPPTVTSPPDAEPTEPGRNPAPPVDDEPTPTAALEPTATRPPAPTTAATPDPAASPEPEPTAEPQPGTTPDPAATAEPSATSDPTAAPESTSTSAPEPTEAATPEPTSTPTPTPTSEPTSTSTPTPTPTEEPTPTPPAPTVLVGSQVVDVGCTYNQSYENGLVSIDTPAFGASETTVGGTNIDGAAHVELRIRNLETNRYWNGSAWVPTAESFLVATGATWSYSAQLPQGTYCIIARGRNSLNGGTDRGATIAFELGANESPSITPGTGLANTANLISSPNNGAAVYASADIRMKLEPASTGFRILAGGSEVSIDPTVLAQLMAGERVVVDLAPGNYTLEATDSVGGVDTHVLTVL